ncbi:MAG: S8 family serine peptidase [Bacteriovoracaceae bacterium]
MMAKKVLFVSVLTLSFSSVYAATKMIPPAYEALKLIEETQAGLLLKNPQGKVSSPIVKAITPENWFNLSPKDGAEGVRSEELYLEIGTPVKEDFIVAVIDSGVDVNHEDLQGKIWINSDEIANNGIDDDNNGYIDDVFGWNFIGGKDGMATIQEDAQLPNKLRLIKGKPEAQVDADNLEITREVVRIKKIKARLEELGDNLSSQQQAYLEDLQKTISNKLSAAQDTLRKYIVHAQTYKEAETVLKAAGVQTITLESVRAVVSEDAAVLKAKEDMLKLLSSNITEARIKKIIDRSNSEVKYFYNEELNTRAIVGDNYTDLSESNYGNNDVIGPDSFHGTHVSGIIAALRDNTLGMKGVATNVKIMAIRAIPNGDERDKDVANAIRYAVNNGAKIINMSFGKAYSPYKKAVDEAVLYAESKGVLLLHAAGNDSQNNDVIANFPNRYHRLEKREFNNWLEIGASSFEKGPGLPATFSNYGKRSVDLFAPGVNIYSTTPYNTYGLASGTSMATPAAAGVAALTLAFKSSLGAEDLREILIDTSRRYPTLKVKIPGTNVMSSFNSLSTAGSIVDAYEAYKVVTQ